MDKSKDETTRKLEVFSSCSQKLWEERQPWRLIISSELRRTSVHSPLNLRLVKMWTMAPNLDIFRPFSLLPSPGAPAKACLKLCMPREYYRLRKDLDWNLSYSLTCDCVDFPACRITTTLCLWMKVGARHWGFISQLVEILGRWTKGFKIRVGLAYSWSYRTRQNVGTEHKFSVTTEAPLKLWFLICVINTCSSGYIKSPKSSPSLK